MVTICEGKRGEKDSAINAFVQETVGQIRLKRMSNHQWMPCYTISAFFLSLLKKQVQTFLGRSKKGQCHDDCRADHSDRLRSQMTSECTACIRAAFKRDFWKNLGFCPNQCGGGVCHSQFLINFFPSLIHECDEK